jgi:hypothetical protein
MSKKPLYGHARFTALLLGLCVVSYRCGKEAAEVPLAIMESFL